jgi:hypothetical protein
MKRKCLLFLVLYVLTFTGLTYAQTAVPTLRTLNIHGEDFSSACVPQDKAALQAQLTTEAWTLIETLLCKQKSTSSNAYVADHIGKTVTYATTSSGSRDETKKTVVNAALIDSLLSEGAAWDPELISSKNEVILKYMSNEVCVRSRTLRLINGTWKIVALGEACD